MFAAPYLRSASLALALLALASGAAGAQQLTAVTMPLQDGGTDHWAVYGDRLIGVDITRGFLKMDGRVNAYSLTEGKHLWRQEFDAGWKMNDGGPVLWFQPERNRLMLGSGPISVVRADGSHWVLSCDLLGPVSLDDVVQLSPDRLLGYGGKSCSKGFGDDVTVFLADGASGRMAWQHKSKGQWFDEPGGYWARVARIQAGGAKSKVLQFRAWPLAPGPNGHQVAVADASAGMSESGAEADRVLIIGERMEVLSMADGTVLWRSPRKVDRLEGVFGPFVFLRDGDKLQAIRAGTGELGWTLELDKAGTTLYSAAYLRGMGDDSPLGPNDLLVSESRYVSRVNLLTGQKVWTVRRDDANWTGTARALLVSGDDATRAYDWVTGALRWEVKQGRRLHPVNDPAAPALLLVDRGKREDGAWVGPFKLVAVDPTSGRVVWSRSEIDGKKVVHYSLAVPGQVRLTSETGAIRNVAIADGTPGAPLQGADALRFVAYSASARALQCRNYAGDVVWERRGEIAEGEGLIEHGSVVVWAAKSGAVEVITTADGSSRWSMKVRGSPRVWVDDGTGRLVVPNGEAVTVVKL